MKQLRYLLCAWVAIGCLAALSADPSDQPPVSVAIKAKATESKRVRFEVFPQEERVIHARSTAKNQVMEIHYQNSFKDNGDNFLDVFLTTAYLCAFGQNIAAAGLDQSPEESKAGPFRNSPRISTCASLQNISNLVSETRAWVFADENVSCIKPNWQHINYSTPKQRAQDLAWAAKNLLVHFPHSAQQILAPRGNGCEEGLLVCQDGRKIDVLLEQSLQLILEKVSQKFRERLGKDEDIIKSAATTYMTLKWLWPFEQHNELIAAIVMNRMLAYLREPVKVWFEDDDEDYRKAVMQDLFDYPKCSRFYRLLRKIILKTTKRSQLERVVEELGTIE